MDNKFLLVDRLQKIRQVINKYGEEKFYVSFSGGKDSTVVSALIDMALPNNNIPRVFSDTGIEFNIIKNFVYDLQKTDNRIIILKPTIPIHQMLEKSGYPFKSKSHSAAVDRYQRLGRTKSIVQYLGERTDKEPWSTLKSCPKILKYQFTPDFKLKISDKCCDKLKKEPLKKWMKETGRCYNINGIMREEGGRRYNALCLSFRSGKLFAFQPLAPVSKEWENWLIQTYNIKICDIYKPPYNFPRTGCKGCPFAVNLQKELETLEKYFPIERKQCEEIWKPVYEEYRRLNYRLKGECTNE